MENPKFNILQSTICNLQFTILGFLCSLLLMSGCKTVDKSDIFTRYNQVTLKQTAAAEVLTFIQDPNDEHLSQSESVVSSWGVENKKRTHWFNMVAFDEEQQLAARKYAMTLEDYRGPNTNPHPNLRLDAAVVIDSQILNDTYPSNNQMRIEVLKKLHKMFSEDARAVAFESETFRRSAMLVNQTLNNLLNKLNSSPALAADLDKVEGLEFDQMVLGESRVRMLIEDDIVKLKIKCGKLWFTKIPFEMQQDVIDM